MSESRTRDYPLSHSELPYIKCEIHANVEDEMSVDITQPEDIYVKVLKTCLTRSEQENIKLSHVSDKGLDPNINSGK